MSSCVPEGRTSVGHMDDILAWASFTGIKAVGIESGTVLAQLPRKGPLKGTPTCMWSFKMWSRRERCGGKLSDPDCHFVQG
jgi:hypothetical protein